MRVTAEIPNALIDDLLKATGEKTKTRAICVAIRDYILQKRKEKLLSLSGKIHFDLDWKEMEEIELKVMEKRKKLGNSCCVTEETPKKTFHRNRALLALEKMQKKSLKSGLNNLTDSQIQSEIRAVRKARRQ